MRRMDIGTNGMTRINREDGCQRMNLTKLFEIQRALDDRIVKEKGLAGKDLVPMKLLALQVELGELANEWRGFKFWSEDQEPRLSNPNCDLCEGSGVYEKVTDMPDYPEVLTCVCASPLLEEYVDCLHFILSIG